MTYIQRVILVGLIVLTQGWGQALAGDIWLGSSHGLLNTEVYASTVQKLFTGKDGSLYAVAETGVKGTRLFKSTDKGESWQYLTPLNGGFATYLITADNTILVGTYYTGIYKSTDNGATWINTKEGLEKDVISFLAEDVNGVLYGFCTGYPGTTPEQRLIKSTDRGATWTTTAQMPTNPQLVGNPLIEINGELYFKVLFGTKKSADQGKTWQPAKKGEDLISQLEKAADGTLYMGTYNSTANTNTMYKSTNNGTNWQSIEITTGQSKLGFALMQLTPAGTLYAMSSEYGDLLMINKLFKSADKGATWTPIGTAGMRATQIQSLLVTSDETIYIGEYQNGVQRLESGVNPNNASDAERVFNWAEALHPETFPRGPTTQNLAGYTVRYYPASTIYLGAKNNHLYVHDGKLLNLLDVGLVGDFLGKAKAAGF